MRRFALRRYLGASLRVPLWGHRERWGLAVRADDPCWRQWEQTSLRFYQANQRSGVGAAVNDAGYRVMSRVELSGQQVLEIGPGDIRHLAHWRGRPDDYVLVDVSSEMLDQAARALDRARVPYRRMIRRRGDPLALPDCSLDVVVSFYSLEHLYPLGPQLQEIERVLRPGGTLIGAIPAEGGLAWGAGRLLTSRRWLKRHSTIDPDKIICWEHPNMADEILAALDDRFDRERVATWPLPWLPLLDINLIITFVYRKRG